MANPFVRYDYGRMMEVLSPTSDVDDFVPPDNNATDLGKTDKQFRYLWLGTGINCVGGSVTVDVSHGLGSSFNVGNSGTGLKCDMFVDGNSDSDFFRAPQFGVYGPGNLTVVTSAATNLRSVQLPDASGVVGLSNATNAWNAGNSFNAYVELNGVNYIPSDDKTGTPGNAVINFSAGKAAVAAGGTNCVVTCNKVLNANAVILITSLGPIDATGLHLYVSAAGVGSFTVSAHAPATADMPFSFVVWNRP